MVKLQRRVWIQAIILAVIILAAFWLAFVLLLNAIGLLATVVDLGSPTNSPVKSVILFFLSGKWWMYLAALILGLGALIIIYELDARRNTETTSEDVGSAAQTQAPRPASEPSLKSDYVKASQMLVELERFATNREAEKPETKGESISDLLKERRDFDAHTGVLFDEVFKSDLLRLTAHLRLEYGLAAIELGDDKILSRYPMPLETLGTVVEGLTIIVEELGNLIVSDAFDHE